MRAVVEPAEVIPGRRVIDLQVAARRRAPPPAGCESMVREPSQSSSMCTFTPRRAASESSSTNVAPMASRNTNVSNVMLVCAVRMALSIAGKICAPLTSVVILLPGHQRRPEQNAERAAEVRIAAGVQPARTVEQALFGGGEIRADPQHEGGDEQGGEDDRDDGHVNYLQMRKDRNGRGMHLTHIGMIRLLPATFASA